jgi:ribosomal protein S18 acetylase RimI-like enzyme
MLEENKIKIRQARLEDIPQILEAEKAAWGKERAATFEMFESRIKTFPEGTKVAQINDNIAGAISTEIVNYDLENDSPNWYEITDNGFIAKTHNPSGDTLYGVNLSVHPTWQNKEIGKELLRNIIEFGISMNLKRGLLGSRIPNYHKFAHKMKVEDYVNLCQQKSGSSTIQPDPELLFYLKCGLKIVKVIPNYFEDPESLNYGVLLIMKNPYL